MAKRTKVICTLGPAVDNETSIRGLISAGMDIARLNLGYGNQAEHKARIERVKRIRQVQGTPTAIMVDTVGPKIRTGRLAGGQPIKLAAGKQIVLTEKDVEGTDRLLTQTHPGLWKVVEPGTQIMLDEGNIELAVDEVRGSDIVCTVQNTGTLGQHKSVNLPGTNLHLPSLTDQDRQDLLFAIEEDVDFIAMSFVRTAADIEQLRRFLAEHNGSDIGVVARIDNRDAVKNADSIIEAADAVIVARGDLGVEIDATEVPHVQKRIVARCSAMHTPVVISTQLLTSMQRSPRPTRGEVTDVANAVYDGVDALMLTGETAIGKYPIQACRMVCHIAESSEPYVASPSRNAVEYPTDALRVARTVGVAAVSTADAINAKCIVTPTTSGRTARLISNLRPKAPIYAVTQRPKVFRRMQILWGVTPFLAPIEDTTMHDTIAVAKKCMWDHRRVHAGDLTVFTAGDFATAPYISEGPHKGVPTNVMYVVQIKRDDTNEAEEEE